MKNRKIDHLLLINLLTENGYRIFSTDDVRQLLKENEFNISDVKKFLHLMKKKELIVPIRRGIYSLAPMFLNGMPIHEYEVAMSLFPSSTICCYSAFHFHGLTDQIPNTVYVGAITSSSRIYKDQGLINNTEYRLIWFKESIFFGQEEVWLGEAKITITDKERTLLDGLARPKDCGGFMEVLNAFKIALNEIDIKKIVEYSLKLDVSTSKRLGWVLSEIGVPESKILKLENLAYKGHIKLDTCGPQQGAYDKKWQIIENI